MAGKPGKKAENAQRLRYIRVLERFHKSIITYLSRTEEPQKAAYDKKVDNSLKYLERVEGVQLYKGEYNDLETLVKKMVAYRQSDEEIDTIKKELLYASNQLEKSINSRRYKKEKHENDKYKDWE